MNSDTPRTDALDKDLQSDVSKIMEQGGNASDAIAHCTANLFKFACQLERELNEARKKIQYVYSQSEQFDCGAAPIEEIARRAKDYIDKIEQKVGIITKDFTVVANQNDQLRKVCDELATELQYGPVAGCKPRALNYYSQLPHVKAKEQSK